MATIGVQAAPLSGLHGQATGERGCILKEGLAINGSSLDLSASPTHHSQVAILGLGNEKLRARCEVNDAIPAWTPCECDAGGKEKREDLSIEKNPLGWASPSVHEPPHVLYLPWLMLILFTRSALRAVLVSVSIT